MTHDYKAALDEVTMAIAKDAQTPKKIKRDAFTTHTLLKNIFTILDALTIAAEYERMKNERDRFAYALLTQDDDIPNCDDIERRQSEYRETLELAKKVRNENENA